MRLLTMGLRVEDELDVITSPSKGQMVIAVDCRRYVIGRGLAQKVLVEPRGKSIYVVKRDEGRPDRSN